MWTMSVLLCFSTKETVSEPYKVEPYTFHVCCLFVFLKRFLRVAFSGRAGVAGRQPPRLPCRMKQKGIFFFIRYKSIKHHLLANTAISHTPTHTHTHTRSGSSAYTHTHPRAQCKMWMDTGAGGRSRSHGKSRSGVNALTVFTSFPCNNLSIWESFGSAVFRDAGTSEFRLSRVAPLPSKRYLILIDVCLVASVGVNVFRSEQQQQQDVGSQVAASFRLDDTLPESASKCFSPFKMMVIFFFFLMTWQMPAALLTFPSASALLRAKAANATGTVIGM